MASPPGGRAEKLGNRYEGLWVIKQYLELLEEKIKNVLIEAIGDDEQGVDLWTTDTVNKRNACQCKARNGSKDAWTAGDLKNREIFSHARYQLDRDPGCTFYFVSAIHATQVSDLCDTARKSPDWNTFYIKYIQKYKIQSTQFNIICQGLRLDTDKETEKAYDYLQRIVFIQYAGDWGTKDDLLIRISYLITGNSEDIYALLIAYAEENNCLGTEITSIDICDFLEKKNHPPKHLDKDKRIVPTIISQQIKFKDSIDGQGFIKTPIIKRKEAQQLLDDLKGDTLLFFVHGSAGCGKSVLLYELAELLKGENIFYFPLRLDRENITAANPQKLGEHFGLPDSPGNCVAAHAGNKPAVLIIDQLDAIRWTGTHTYQLLDLCKQLIRELLSLNEAGKKIKGVITCRSFDYRNDPQIGNWIQNQKQKTKIMEIHGITDDDVQQVVGVDEYNTLSKKQKEMLRTPLYLKLWSEIMHRDSLHTTICTTQQLIAAAWKHYRERMENERNIPGKEIIEMNNKIVAYCDKNSKPGAPQLIINNFSRRTRDAFFSFGILREYNNYIYYSHESFLDFFIPQKIMKEIEDGKSIIEWLGDKKQQHLSRRRKLQQLLFLMAAENSKEFERVNKKIIESVNVRFLLKQGALSVLAEYKDYSENFILYLIEKLEDPEWKHHILNTVIVGKEHYIKELLKRGIVFNWLSSGNQEDIYRTTRLLSDISLKIPYEIYEFLSAQLDKSDEWNKKILQSLPGNMENDSKELFKLRLLLMERGLYRREMFFGLGKIASINPEGCLKIIEIILKSWKFDGDTQNLTYEIEADNWYEESEKQVTSIAEKIPEQVYDVLIPHITRLTEKMNYYSSDWDECSPYESYSTKKTCIKLVKNAISKLAEKHPGILFHKLQKLASSCSIIIKEIYKYGIYSLPVCYADYCISWFLEDFQRLEDTRTSGSPWDFAAQCIKKHSPFCSNDLFNELEKRLITYYSHKIDKKYLADTKKYRYHTIKKTEYNGKNFLYGEPQLFFLPALDPERRSIKTQNLITTLQRRFQGIPKERFFNNPLIIFGKVTSKLSGNLDKISDRSWLQIITKPSNFFKTRGNRIVQTRPDEILESSIEQFARSLELSAEKQPHRFIKLANQFTQITRHEYITAIYSAMRLTIPPKDLHEDLKKNWQSGPIDLIIKFIEKFPPIDEINQATAFCRLIRDRYEEKWPLSILKYLTQFAENHPDPDAKRTMADIKDLDIIALNSVRGSAAIAIGALLFKHETLLDFFLPTIEKLIIDAHLAVRTAVLQIILPMLNINRDKAIDYYIKTVAPATSVAATRDSISILNYAIKKYYVDLQTIVIDMYKSNKPKISETGAKIIAAYNLCDELFDDIIEECLQSTAVVRKGLASIYVDFLGNPVYTERCMKYLKFFFNDPDDNIRKEASLFIRDSRYEHITIAGMDDFIKDFISSPAFTYESDYFFRFFLKKYYRSIIPFTEIIFKTCDTLISENDSQPVLFNFLLSIYDQNLEKNPDYVYKALDYMDLLLEKRIVYPTLLDEIDK